MTTQLHDTGEEAILDHFFEESITKPASIDVGLYNDSTDALTDTGDLADITTEPAGASYARQSATFGTADFTTSDNSGDWEAIIADQTFDTSDSSQSVDSYFTVFAFDSDDTSDGGTTTDHLLFTGSLDQSYDLSNIDSFTLSGAGLSLT